MNMRDLKTVVKRLPGIGPALSTVWTRVVRRRARFQFERVALDAAGDLTREQRQLLNLLSYTKASNTYYAAADYPAGYHTIRIADCNLDGRRDPLQRLDLVPFSFDNASVLDLGCNQGGMLFALADRLRWGVGVDFDNRMVNAANRIKSYGQIASLDFYVFDLDKEDLDLLQDFLPTRNVDIIFLLSVCMWIDRWREVIEYCSELSPRLLFEANGSGRQRAQQHAQLVSTYRSIQLLASSSDDDAHQKERQLYLCER